MTISSRTKEEGRRRYAVRGLIEEVEKHLEAIEDIVCVADDAEIDMETWQPLCDYICEYQIEINSVVAQRWFCDLLEKLTERNSDDKRIEDLLEKVSSKVLTALNLE